MTWQEEQLWNEIVEDAKQAAKDGRDFCCPFCLNWFATREEKHEHMKVDHEVQVLSVSPIEENSE